VRINEAAVKRLEHVEAVLVMPRVWLHFDHAEDAVAGEGLQLDLALAVPLKRAGLEHLHLAGEERYANRALCPAKYAGEQLTAI